MTFFLLNDRIFNQQVFPFNGINCPLLLCPQGKGLLQTYFLLSKDGFHPVESSLFDELHSTYSMQDKSKPYSNGGSKSMTNPPNSEIVVNTHCHIESPKVLDCVGNMNDSKMSVNNLLTEVSVA